MKKNDTKANGKIFRRNVRFPMQGNYHFAITNGMRDSAIVGLSHIGFRIEYSNMNESHE